MISHRRCQQPGMSAVISLRQFSLVLGSSATAPIRVSARVRVDEYIETLPQ